MAGSRARRNDSVLARLLALALLLHSGHPGTSGHPDMRRFTSFEAPDLVLGAATRDATLRRLAALGARRLRVVMYWRDVAPDPASPRPPGRFDASRPGAYPAGAWAPFDAALAGAGRLGMRVLLAVSGPVPRWATRARRDQVTRPLPSAYRRFMTAVGRRYGNRVLAYSVWNEPNHPQFLEPQKVGGRAVSGTIYRPLYQAGRRGLRAAGVRRPVLFGETAPRGSVHDVAPLLFLRQALCLDSAYRRRGRCRRLAVDGYAHHPYTIAGGPFFRPPNPDDVTIGVLGRLTRALRRAGRAGAIPRRVPVWLTEFGVQSYPDRLAGVSPALQSDFRSISEWLAAHTPGVRGFSQYLLRDARPLPGPPIVRYSGFESGLEYSDGRRKPAYDSFRLPLVARRAGRRVALWGVVRPGRGPGTVTVLGAPPRSARFRALGTVAYGGDGTWSACAPYRAGERFRVSWTDAGGHTLLGPPTAVYAFG